MSWPSISSNYVDLRGKGRVWDNGLRYEWINGRHGDWGDSHGVSVVNVNPLVALFYI
ncbi:MULTISPECIES: hypothetical protein [Okeania]|uniref:hypothetical protein n=1 Tax=Okeania TaxID=1458928 RepID=UPI001374D2B0|nr:MULTISPECIES: hypothetical protein [Okeania]NET14015.1 hypothetical protein [Okeania sp. SIO1H6]NEP70504.1 hypothetical protein [Okeania sp. SIO2G5]NEP87262.1 hypothetical protein [Okeania sp. SIO2C2]NEP92734.1 hypothetical protein [Okeania sp. SIO2F5]NEQ90335.1 hypothetical protein [Okeania sp. SIO2G4]